MKKIYIKTYGCQMNIYDSDKIFIFFKKYYKKIIKTNNIKEANIMIMNTCSIREKAQDKVFSELGRWKKLKNLNPEIIIGVSGCVSTQEGNNIFKKAPFVNMVFGPQNIHNIPKMLHNLNTKKNNNVLDIEFKKIEKFDSLIQKKNIKYSEYVSIMEGCSKHCTFCIVPYTRGEEISRPLYDVLKEVAYLAKNNTKEIILLGQNVNSYNGYIKNYKIRSNLSLLIRYINKIENIKRIRFITSHPSSFSQNLIDTFKDIKKLSNHLHLPVQSGSDRILGLMKRNYTTLEYKDKIRRLRKVRKDISISSDFIVGFPGETEEDFNQSINLVEEIGFDHSYSFIYSKRPGTIASTLKDDITQETKKKRLLKLQKILKDNTYKISNSMVNNVYDVLITQVSNSNSKKFIGRTENNRIVNITTKKYNENIIGNIIRVNIKKNSNNYLYGEEI